MTSLLLSGPIDARRVGLLTELTFAKGHKSFFPIDACSPFPKIDPCNDGVVCFFVEEVEELRAIAEWYTPAGKQLLLGTALTREQLEPMREELKRYHIQIKYLSADTNPNCRRINEEWAKTWHTMFPWKEPFLLDQRVRQRVKESKNVLAVLSWEQSGDQEKIFMLALDDDCRPSLLEQADCESRQKIMTFLRNHFRPVEHCLLEVGFPKVLTVLILGYLF